jgi:hypothetical protein
MITEVLRLGRTTKELGFECREKQTFSGAFVKSRKTTISCVMFVYLSVRMEQLGTN